MDAIYWIAIFYFVPTVYCYFRFVFWHVKMKDKHDLTEREAKMLAAIFNGESRDSFIPILNIFTMFTLGKKIKKIEKSLEYVYESGGSISEILENIKRGN